MSALEAVERHRRAQIQLAARAAREVAAAWQLLDPTDVDRTLERWLQTTLGIVARNRSLSARLGAAHYLDLRDQSGVTARMPERIPPVDADTAAITTSMVVTGPNDIKARTAATEGGFTTPIAALAGSKVVGAAVRHVLGGGRGAIINRIQVDRAAIGVARVTSGKPCAFCAMLASRGAVYKDRSQTSAGFQSHDACKCQPMTIYRRGERLPASNTQFADLWAESTDGLGGDRAINAFRQALANN